MNRPRICVVGACNIDLISYVPRLPVLGETLHGSRFNMGFGGKGANQAVMAAKLGGEVSMVSKLGRDVFGENTKANFERMGIDTQHVPFTEKAFSGVAPIAVDAHGNNSIIIVTGANDLLTIDEIEAAGPVIASAQIMVCQLEIPTEITLAAMRIAHEQGIRTIFNPAPARPDLPEELYGLSDIFCPNESETEILTGLPVTTIDEAQKAAAVLLERGAATVILTLGERGSLLVTQDTVQRIPVEPVKAIDTTGAGDCFVGSLAFFLAAGKSMTQAIERANSIASISVQAPGTQTSFPDAADLPPDILDARELTDDDKQETEIRMTARELAQYIDHTLLKPDAVRADFDRLCDEARQYGFKAVCVNSNRVSYISQKLEGSGILVCSVIGFPLGSMHTGAKVAEARQALRDGAVELDMVIDIGSLKSGDYGAVAQDIRALRDEAPHPTMLKVIIETCLLTDDEKRKACELAESAGADFVKTSTGFSTGGATLKDVKLMREAAGPGMGVKASGGIRDAQTALAMIAAGANRIGAGAGVAIVSSLEND